MFGNRILLLDSPGKHKYVMGANNTYFSEVKQCVFPTVVNYPLSVAVGTGHWVKMARPGQINLAAVGTSRQVKARPGQIDLAAVGTSRRVQMARPGQIEPAAGRNGRWVKMLRPG